jgi:hypothetical protein
MDVVRLHGVGAKALASADDPQARENGEKAELDGFKESGQRAAPVQPWGFEPHRTNLGFACREIDNSRRASQELNPF